MQPTPSAGVGFEQDCLGILRFLPETFDEGDLEIWVPWLRRRHRDLMNHRRRLLDMVERFEEEGLVADTGYDSWEKRTDPETEPHIDLGLAEGDRTDRPELARILQMKGDAALRRGMFKPASGPFADQLLLFHDPYENPYGDIVGSEKIHYVGQGQTGDQKLRSYNRYLAEHLKRGLQVHFFEKEDESGSLAYRGEVVCQDVERVFRPDEGRSVLVFELVQADPVSPGEHWEPTRLYQVVQDEISTTRGRPRLEERERRQTVAQRLVRDTAFRDILFEAYDRHCAVCGTPLEIEDLTELEAAHIVAVSEDGPDDPRNGLCLCVRHHWAFDNGIFTLTGDLEIDSFLTRADPHGEIVDGAELTVPQRPGRRPHEFYVRHHREKWTAIMS